MAQAEVHRSAIIEGDVRLADDVRIGPHCVVFGTCGPVEIGAGTTLVATAHVNGPLRMGEGNLVYPGACLGFAPQDVAFDPNHGGAGTVIGDRNVFREGANIHRGKTAEPTRIGNHNFFMSNAHVGHDCVVDNHCIIATGAMLAGHVHVADRVLLSGNAMVHQFCRLGRGSMISGGAGATLDLPMWFTATATGVAGSLNMVGMRRNGLSEQQIQAVRWVYKTLYRSGCAPTQAYPLLEARADDPIVAEYIAFLKASKRGICHGAGRTSRGGVPRIAPQTRGAERP